MKLIEAIELFTLHICADGRSEHTVSQFARHLRLLNASLVGAGEPQNLDEIDPQVIARFLVSPAARTRPDCTPKKPTSVNTLRSSIRGFFSFAAAAGWCRSDPSRLVRRARCGVGPPKALTAEEQRKLLAALDAASDEAAKRDRGLFTLLISAGLRVGSGVALRIEDIDFDAGRITLQAPKGGRPGVVYVPAHSIDLLRDLVGARTVGPVFDRGDGRPITARHARRRLAQIAKRAGIRGNVGPHRLRHSFATKLLAATGDVALVQRALLHRSIGSTMVYATVADERVRDAQRTACTAE